MTASSIDAVILRWLAARAAQVRSPAGTILDLARLGALVQSDRGACLDKMDRLPIVHVTREEIDALEAVWLPDPPRTWRPPSYHPVAGWVRGDEVARRATDREAARALCLDVAELRRRVDRARDEFRRALARMEGE